MSERFLKRWSRLKNEGGADAPAADAEVAVAAPGPSPAAPSPAELALPTLEDAASLAADSDYSAFVARGVDPSVRRLAMKKLFADPHFNIVDGLDIHMSDYTKADPMPAAMLAALHVAKDFLVEEINKDEPIKGPE